MVKLVLMHKVDSIYEDEPDAVYDFPRSYLKAVEEAFGDWEVPRTWHGQVLETNLAHPDGTAKSGGQTQSAVRRLPEADFAQIVDIGLPGDLERVEAHRYDASAPDLGQDKLTADRPLLERLSSRPYRDVAFRRKVRSAYDYLRALSGLRLRNGGGRPEVQAAHIRPVAQQRSDFVRNGLAPSGPCTGCSTAG